LPQWHGDLNKRKKTGGRKRPYRGKRAYEMGGEPVETRLDEKKIKVRRCRGGNFKVKALAYNVANVANPKTGETKVVKIKRVVENPANRDYERRGILTKGAVIETEMGRARVTSRPGQHGVINATLIG